MATRRGIASFFTWIGSVAVFLWLGLFVMTLLDALGLVSGDHGENPEFANALCHFREWAGHLTFVSFGYIAGHAPEMVKRDREEIE